MREDLDKRLLNFHHRPMVFLTLDVITFMCPLNIKERYAWYIRAKCFCVETCWTGFSLKKIGGCAIFLIFKNIMSSCN